MSRSFRAASLTAAALTALLVFLAPGCTSAQGARASAPAPRVASGAVQLVVLYPQPTDADQFEADYRAHLRLLHDAMGFDDDALPYTVTRFRPTATGPAPYYQQFTWTLPSAAALQEARARPGMQEVAADAVRISSGGAPVIMVGDVR